MEPKKPVSVAIPQDAKPAFSNTVHIAVSDDSVAMQFVYIRPPAASGQLISEIVMSPKHAIEFSRALDATLKKHFTRHLQA